MGSRKSIKKKVRLATAMKRNQPVPLFVVAKTNRKVRHNVHRRRWRTQKLKKREKE